MGFERWIGVVAGLGAGVMLLLYMYAPSLNLPQLSLPNFGAWFAGADKPLEAPLATPDPPPLEVASEEQVAQYPVPVSDATPALAVAAQAPDLAVSDDSVRSEIARAMGEPVEAFLVPKRVIQNLVATLDSLDREPAPMRFRAVVEVPGQPVVEKTEDSYHLSSDNEARYHPFIAALGSGDGTAAARLYLRWYPLFQRAYREMGYPDAHFNDRVVAVIDHLLATPDVARPIELVRPGVLYEFADPELERLSSGQKTMIRIGPANAQAVKARLREVRSMVATSAR